MKHRRIDVPHELTDGGWPSQLMATDSVENWSSLVEHIAELEALLGDYAGDVDARSMRIVARIQTMIEHKRRCLHACDVGVPDYYRVRPDNC